MKNSVTLTLVTIIILAVGLSCSIWEKAQEEATGSNTNRATANSNKSLADKAVDVAVGDEKIGIPECDEVADILAEQLNNPDDDILTKAAKTVAKNQFKEQLKRQLENNKTDKKSVAKFCVEFKRNLATSTEEPANKEKE